MQGTETEDPPRRKRGRPRKDATGNGAVKRPKNRLDVSENGPAKRPRGRPRKDVIDADILGQLALRFCPLEEAAAILGLTEQNLRYHIERKPALAKVWSEGCLKGKARLRGLLWTHAARPDSSGVQALLHMCKHYLGQHDRIRVSVEDMVAHFTELPDSDYEDYIKLKKKALAEIKARYAAGGSPDLGGDSAATRH